MPIEQMEGFMPLYKNHDDAVTDCSPTLGSVRAVLNFFFKGALKDRLAGQASV